MPNDPYPFINPYRLMYLPFHETLRYRPRKRLTWRKKRVR